MTIYMLYRALALLLPALGLLNLWRRSLRERAYRERIRERFGFAPETVSKHSIWFHTVSAGEAIAATPLIEQVVSAFPERRVLVTTTTPTGSAEIRRRLGDTVDHCYLPFDSGGCVRRFLNRVQPSILFLLETEIWPTLIISAGGRDIPIYLLNARLSERSAKGYRYINSLMRYLFPHIHGLASQFQDTADRFRELGYPGENIQVVGNVKFDLMLPEDIQPTVKRLKTQWEFNSPTWIAASTHPGEDEVVLQAHLEVRKQLPELRLILVPRHPHRVGDVATLVQRQELSAALLSDAPRPIDVLVVDQMGVLLTMYGLADVAFIGGSLQGTGGHNPIEAAVFRLPMLMGPDRHNFKEICQRFSDQDCIQTVHDWNELANALTRLLANPELRVRRGESALAIVQQGRGATARLFELVSDWTKAAR